MRIGEKRKWNKMRKKLEENGRDKQIAGEIVRTSHTRVQRVARVLSRVAIIIRIMRIESVQRDSTSCLPADKAL